MREGRAWLDFARQVEDSGIDVLLLRDHFSGGAFGQQLAPFSGLAAAAAVTTRLRLGWRAWCHLPGPSSPGGFPGSGSRTVNNMRRRRPWPGALASRG